MRKSAGHSPQPWRRHRQPAVAVGSRHCGLSKRLLPAAGTRPTDSVWSLSEDASSLFRRSSPVAWTTATLCSSAFLKDWWAACSRFRTPPLGWLWLMLLGVASLATRCDHLTPVLHPYNTVTTSKVPCSVAVRKSAVVLSWDCRLIVVLVSDGYVQSRACVITMIHSSFGDLPCFIFFFTKHP